MANWNSVYGLGPDRVPGIDFEEKKGKYFGPMWADLGFGDGFVLTRTYDRIAGDSA